jgi:hypothetical protein
MYFYFWKARDEFVVQSQMQNVLTNMRRSERLSHLLASCPYDVVGRSVSSRNVTSVPLDRWIW